MKKNTKIELTTMIGKGSRIIGELKIKGGIRIDGEIEGTLDCDGLVIIGISGVAKADISASDCIISGTVNGNLDISGTLELGKSSKINGDVFAEVLKIEAGANLNGNCSMDKSKKVSQESKISEESQPLI